MFYEMENIFINDKWYKTDENTIINTQYIHWIKKFEKKYEVCCKPNGCYVGTETHTISESKSPNTYRKINTIFDTVSD